MVSNIIYRAIPFPMKEVLPDSYTDNNAYQLSSQLIPPAPLELEDLSFDSMTSEIAHVCIDSCDSLSIDVPPKKGNSKKRRALVKKARKQRRGDLIKRVPLDIVYGNSLLKKTMDIKENEKETPVFLSVTDMRDIDRVTQPDNGSSERNVSCPIKEKKELIRCKKSLKTHPIMDRKFELKITNDWAKIQESYQVYFTRIARLPIKKLSVKRQTGRVSKKQTPSIHPNSKIPRFNRIPVLRLKRVTQPQ